MFAFCSDMHARTGRMSTAQPCRVCCSTQSFAPVKPLPRITLVQPQLPKMSTILVLVYAIVGPSKLIRPRSY